MSDAAGSEVPKTSEEKPVTSSAVFSMFGGGAKKEKKDDDEDRGDVSGSNKAQREAAAAAKDEDADDQAPESEDVHFEPVIKLTDEVETKTFEEDEIVLFKMRAKLFRFDHPAGDWKERGTGDVRLLGHKENRKTRLLMRRDKTLKVCANHYVSSDMHLQPNVGSDRSWVWKAFADATDGVPTSETFAIRFANSENALEFKKAFDRAREVNAEIWGGRKTDKEEKEEEEDKEEDVKEEATEATEAA